MEALLVSTGVVALAEIGDKGADESGALRRRPLLRDTGAWVLIAG